MHSQLRLALVGAALLGLSVGSFACLVTDKVAYGEPNFPPRVAKVQPSDTALSVRVPSRPQCGDDTDTERTDGSWMRFSAAISDPNVDDDMDYKVLVNGALAAFGPVVRTDRAERGTVTVCVDRASLGAPCNRVDFLASSNFGGGSQYDTRIEGDLGMVTWTVLGNAAQYPEVYQSDCDPADGGAP